MRPTAIAVDPLYNTSDQLTAIEEIPIDSPTTGSYGLLQNDSSVVTDYYFTPLEYDHYRVVPVYSLFDITTTDNQKAIFKRSRATISNSPNPFNPSTTINFTLENKAMVNVFIYELNGKLVDRLLSYPLAVGEHSVSWNGKDFNSNDMGSGTYIAELLIGKNKQTRKIVLVR